MRLRAKAFLGISKVLMDQGKNEESREAIKESLKVASEITNDYYKSKAYLEISKVLLEQGKKREIFKSGFRDNIFFG